MRRILKIAFIIGFLLLIAYAFVEPVRATLQKTLGPPLSKFLGGTYTAVTTSPFWLQYIAPTLNAFIIGMIIMVPIAWFWHRSIYNRVRGAAVRSAVRESGPQIMSEPVSQPVAPIQPTPVATQEASPPPPPPKPETTPAPAETETET